LLILTWQSLQQPGGEGLLRGGAAGTQTDLLAYILPPQRHPLLGSWTAGTYGRFAINAHFWAYIGLVPLALAILVVIVRPRKALPWLLAGLFFFVLALGPILRFNGNVYPEIKLPFGLATDLFSTFGFNWPNRFNLGLMAAVSVLVGLASAYLSDRFQKSWLLVIPAALILFEYAVVPQQTTLAPPNSDFYSQIAADGEDYALVDLPLTRSDGEVHRYFQTIHTKPLVGGWDYRIPDSAREFMLSNPFLATWVVEDFASDPGNAPEQALADLEAAGVRYLVIHKNQTKSVPESMRFLINALEPVFQDRDIIVFSLEGALPHGVGISHWVGDSLGLVRPTLFLHLGRSPLLSLYMCWYRTGEDTDADAYRLALSMPDGSPVYEETRPLPGVSRGLTCDFVTVEWDPPHLVGEYDLRVTPLAKGQPLDTYTTKQPLQALETRRGVPFPAMGFASPATFDVPLEVLGYNLIGGDGFVWADLFLRSTEKHQGSYVLSLQLVGPDSDRDVSHSDDIIPYREWKQGDLHQERRLLWLDGVPPGQYALRILLQSTPLSVPPAPGDVAVLDVPLLVLPASQKGSTALEEGWIVAYTQTPQKIGDRWEDDDPPNHSSIAVNESQNRTLDPHGDEEVVHLWVWTGLHLEVLTHSLGGSASTALELPTCSGTWSDTDGGQARVEWLSTCDEVVVMRIRSTNGSFGPDERYTLSVNQLP
jgi:hypothetical protein